MIDNVAIRGAVAPVVLPAHPAREIGAAEAAEIRAAEGRAIAGARVAAAAVVAASKAAAIGYACDFCPAVGLAPSDFVGAYCVDCAPAFFDTDADGIAV
jgi:hypothetical protein